MPDVLRAVLRLLQGAQEHGLEQLHVRSLARGLEQLRIVLRRGLVAARELQSEFLQELAQVCELLRSRSFVNAVERGLFVLGEKIGCADVRRKHALFDDAMGVVALDPVDALDAPFRVEDELGFDRLEVDRAPLLARLEERPEELVQQLQARQQGFQFQPRLSFGIGERCRNRSIGEPGARAHHRRIEAIAADLAPGADRHVADHAQAVDFSVERAQAVRELLGKHRNDAAGKVDRVAALARLQIESVATLHVVAHIRDGNDQAEPSARLFAVHGVVEIPGRFAVDGDELERSQILPAGEVARTRHGRKPSRERLGLRRELEWQLVFPERDLDLDSGIGGLAEHFDHAPYRLRVAVGLRGQFRHDDLAGPRISRIFRRDKDGLADAPLGGLNEEKFALADQAPHHPGVRARYHLDDRRFAAAATVHARLAHHHDVAVKNLAHFVRTEIKIFALLGNHEAVAVGMPLDAPLDQIELGGDQDRALAIAQDLAVALHRAQAPLERIALLGLDGEPLREFSIGERDAGLRERLHDELAARNRMLVARGFAFAMRVA